MTEEYIKKEDALNKVEELKKIHFDRVVVLNKVSDGLNGLQTFSNPDTAKPEEGAELIDRRQIKWYGCDHEGHIKGINCETADCSKCFHATVEHDEVMSLPVYRIPDSAENKGEWIYDKSIENWRCSKCGQTPPPTGYVGKADFMATHFKFCNHCGADMREPKGEKEQE